MKGHAANRKHVATPNTLPGLPLNVSTRIGRLIVALRAHAILARVQQHCVGENLLADFAGQTMPVLAREAGVAFQGPYLCCCVRRIALHVCPRMRRTTANAQPVSRNVSSSRQGHLCIGANRHGSVRNLARWKIPRRSRKSHSSCGGKICFKRKALWTCVHKALISLVGARGFEPPTTRTPCKSCPSNRHATAWTLGGVIDMTVADTPAQYCDQCSIIFRRLSSMSPR